MRVPKTGSRRIEFKTKTDEQKMLYEQKKEELGFKTLSAMARHALEQLGFHFLTLPTVDKPRLVIDNDAYVRFWQKLTIPFHRKVNIGFDLLKIANYQTVIGRGLRTI